MEAEYLDNPLYDPAKLLTAVEHACRKPHLINRLNFFPLTGMTCLHAAIVIGSTSICLERRHCSWSGVTRTYGVEIMSINIISASPMDKQLTRSLAAGAVASAEALQAETSARGKARAVAIHAGAEASCAKISASGVAEAAIIKAKVRSPPL